MIWELKKLWYRTYQSVMKCAMLFLDWSEPQLLEGKDSVLRLPELVKSKGVKKVLLVSDKVLTQLGLFNPLLEKLTETGIEYVVYNDVQPNPTIPNIEGAREAYISNGCDGIIAFGGGSSMDCAKVAAARVVKPNQSVRKMRGLLKVMHKLPPFFAVPTTAGTGSETTVAAVVTDPETHEKNAVNDICLRPRYAVLDPVLTVGLPPHVTSTTGMDALTHAVEAYIGRSNTKQTIDQAEKATKLIFDNIEEAYNNGSNYEARANMLKGSYWAGCAFTRAYVGYVHSIAHNLGGLYGTPHGLANAVILPYVLDWYGDSIYTQLAKLADIVGIAGSNEEDKAKKFIAEIRRLNADMNIPDKFDMIKEEDLPVLIERALKEGNPVYPVPKIMNAKDMEGVIRTFMA